MDSSARRAQTNQVFSMETQVSHGTIEKRFLDPAISHEHSTHRSWRGTLRCLQTILSAAHRAIAEEPNDLGGEKLSPGRRKTYVRSIRNIGDDRTWGGYG
jgi:hypothetical protein